MFACMYVCVLVAYLLRNSWTNLAKLFFVSPVLVGGWFQAKKILDPDSGLYGKVGSLALYTYVLRHIYCRL